MTEETTKYIICYIQTDNGIVILGQYENIDLTFRGSIEEALPIYLQNEIQLAFVLLNGDFNTELNKRLLRFNITFNDFNCDHMTTLENDKEKISKGRWEIYHCKYDTPYKDSLEGIAENIRFIENETVEEFITSNK